MNRQDLQWLLAFAKSHSLMKELMKEPITIVLPLWLKDLEDYYNDMVADYWIDSFQSKLFAYLAQLVRAIDC